MEIWLDTCDTKSIKTASTLGITHGVTTNPSILAGSREDPEHTIKAILEAQNGPLAVQVNTDIAEEMFARASTLHAFSKRIIIKVPVTEQGLIVIRQLTQNKIPVMATAIYHPRQMLLAALAGADYAAPYIGRMFDAGIEAYLSLESMLKILNQYKFPTKIIAAALRTTDQIMACAEMGVHAVTIKTSLFEQLVSDDTLTLDSLKSFAED